MHWIIVIISFSVIIIIHELGHLLAAKKIGIKVERFSIGFGRPLLKLKKGETEFVISAIPLGGYVKMAGEDINDERTGAEYEFSSKSIFKRFIVIISGAAFNIISALVVMSFLFMIGGTAVPSGTSVVGRVIEGYPAEKAGIKNGDIVLSIDNKRMAGWDEITSAIHKNEGTPITLKIRREGRVFDVTVIPKTEEHKDIFGRDIKMSLIGIAPEIINKKYNPLTAVYMGTKTTVLLTGKIYQGIWLIITKQISLKNVSGPIGIVAMTGDAAKSGPIALLSFLALISVNLAVVNLLPFPILDGGHVLFLGLEKLRGRALTRKTQEVITQVAFYLLIALLITVSYNDLLRRGIISRLVNLGKR